MQGAYQGLPSNRIRSNKQEVINKKQKLINKEEVVITKREAIIRELPIARETVDIIKQDNKSAAVDNGLNTVIKVFEENVHAITPLVYEKILDFTRHVNSDVIIMAIHEAVNYNAKTMKYITKVLGNWISNGLKTDSDVLAYQKRWANKKSIVVDKKVKRSNFCDYEQRNYDFNTLEKQLLGIA
ncbi:DnaD domain-containing protein [Clostridium psychrophilum]|uniref:DnaD domain-containing protein n=1 Tax=Clostridium psychrophilum TaxID=132926 RepID=UPI001C0BE429|nr:DnaD domain protein [Clostridium psychrophilum]MBU3182529.1 DnaD domain protein [Clostridium psychrophilum]